MTSQPFQFDFTDSIITKNNLLYTKNFPTDWAVNYFLALKEIRCEEASYAVKKYQETGGIKNKKGRYLPIFVCYKFYKQEYLKKLAPQFYKAKTECLVNNDPKRNQILFLDYFYNKKYKINSSVYDPRPEESLGVEYLSEYKHRVFLENIFRKKGILGGSAKRDIGEIEDLNMDFLLNIKWDITPNVAIVGSEIKLDPTMCRSHLIALTDCHLHHLVNHFDKLDSMDKTDFFKEKKIVEKKMGCKLDFRKSKHIKKFVNNMTL